MQESGWLGQVRQAAKVDFRPGPRQPHLGLVALATVVALGVSLGTDRLLVLVGTSIFPSTKGYVHFRFSDYAELTTIGVVAACLGWPLVTRVSSQPRWLFARLAVLVTVVLLAPDAWILAQGEPIRAVVVLVAMHLAIAVITYQALIRLAPAERPSEKRAPADRGGEAPAPIDTARVPGARAGRRKPSRRAVWLSMVGLISLDSALGIVALVMVPNDRPTGVVPVDGRAIYVAHAVVGMVLGLGAAYLVVTRSRSGRLQFNCAVIGLIGTVVAAGGGSLTIVKADRLAGAGLMLVGALVAGFAYLTPATEPKEAPAPLRQPVRAVRRPGPPSADRHR